MKLRLNKSLLVVLLSVMSLSFMTTSCDFVGIGIEVGNGTNDYRETTSYLCSRVWIDEWEDDYGVYHYQELRFYTNNTGEDYTYTQDRHGYKKETSYSFTWDWYDAMYTSLRLKYGPGDFSYMENIRMGNNRLDCLYDGYPAYFYGK